MTNPAEVLTDDLINRICHEVQYRVGCIDMDARFADRVADIVKNELHKAQIPTHQFVVEIRADNLHAAGCWLQERIGGNDRARWWSHGLAAMATAPED